MPKLERSFFSSTQVVPYLEIYLCIFQRLTILFLYSFYFLVDGVQCGDCQPHAGLIFVGFWPVCSIRQPPVCKDGFYPAFCSFVQVQSSFLSSEFERLVDSWSFHLLTEIFSRRFQLIFSSIRAMYFVKSSWCPWCCLQISL